MRLFALQAVRVFSLTVGTQTGDEGGDLRADTVHQQIAGGVGNQFLSMSHEQHGAVALEAGDRALAAAHEDPRR